MIPATASQELETLLDQSPSKAVWNALMEIVMAADAALQPELVEMLAHDARLAAWDPRLRACPEGEWSAMLDRKQLATWWPLIRHLDFESNEGYLHPIPWLESIESLHILPEMVYKLDELAALTQLRILQFSEDQINFDCEVLGTLVNLEELRWTLVEMPDIEFIRPLKKLRLLHLNFCVALTDISPLADLPLLEEVSLRGCEGIEDITPLFRLKQLRRLFLQDNPISAAEIKAAKPRKLQVIWY